MALSELAAKVWQLSEDYIPLAMAHLSLGAPYEDKPAENRLDTRRETLRVQYLFPGIAKPGFDALVRVRTEQWWCKGALGFEHNLKTVAASVGAEHREAFYEEAKTVVRGFMGGLSALQRELLEEKFFKIEE